MIIRDYTLVERYAEAFFHVARRSGSTSLLVGQANAILPSFQLSSKLRYFLEAPQINTEDKEQVLERSLKGIVDPLMYNLLLLLLRKARISETHGILERFCELVENDQGIYEADIETARALDPAEKLRLQRELESFTKARLRINYSVNPDLIGGVRFSYGDVLVDDTVRGKLHRLREQLKLVVHK